MFKGLIKRPIAVTMVLIAVMVLGIAAIRKLPVSLVPDINVPQITVQVTSPERSARELNDVLMEGLRSQLTQVAHLQDIVCTSKDGSGLVEMTFEYGADADYIFIDVNDRVDRATSGWGAGEERPMIARASATDIPAFFINISLKDPKHTGGTLLLEMSDFCRQVIVRRLEQLPQVAMVDIKGAPVTFDLERLTSSVKKVAAGETCGWPVYDRLLHNPVEDAIQVNSSIVLLEGNYLLLDEDGWRDLSAYADYTISIRAEEDFLRSRLIDRKMKTGVDEKKAVRFVNYSDMPNVRICLEKTKTADLQLTIDASGNYHVHQIYGLTENK